MTIGSIVEYNLCDNCLNGDNSVYAECDNMCGKKKRTGFIKNEGLQYDENEPDIEDLPVNEVEDFETGKTSIILDEDLRIISSVDKATQKP